MSTHSNQQMEVSKKPVRLIDALGMIEQLAFAKFKESVDVSIHLGVDPRKMTVRGVCPMPSGLGKDVKIAFFAKGDSAKAAQEAGADRVGAEDLVAEILEQPWENYDVVFATPDMMPTVSKLAKKLGPKGLMPNPKLGTVTQNVKESVLSSKAGQVKFRLDKAGIIHCSIGKVGFTAKQLHDNATALVSTLKKLKPAAAKGQYIKKMYVNTTMSKRSLIIDLNTLEEGGVK